MSVEQGLVEGVAVVAVEDGTVEYVWRKIQELGQRQLVLQKAVNFEATVSSPCLHEVCEVLEGVLDKGAEEAVDGRVCKQLLVRQLRVLRGKTSRALITMQHPDHTPFAERFSIRRAASCHIVNTRIAFVKHAHVAYDVGEDRVVLVA